MTYRREVLSEAIGRVVKEAAFTPEHKKLERSFPNISGFKKFFNSDPKGPRISYEKILSKSPLLTIEFDFKIDQDPPGGTIMAWGPVARGLTGKLFQQDFDEKINPKTIKNVIRRAEGLATSWLKKQDRL